MRGDTSRAPLPNTGNTRKFSVRYWMKTRPCASGSGSGGSTISLGDASFSIAINGDDPIMSLALDVWLFITDNCLYYDRNGTKISRKSCFTPFPACRLGMYFERLCLRSSLWRRRLSELVPSLEAGKQSRQGVCLNLAPFRFTLFPYANSVSSKAMEERLFLSPKTSIASYCRCFFNSAAA